MKIQKSGILKTLKTDLENAKSARRIIDNKISVWKDEYNGEKYGNEIKGRSQLVSRDIKKQSEWQHPALVEPFISTPDIIKAKPVTSEDAIIAPKIEILLNTQFCRQFNRYNFINKAVKVLDQEGTCIIRTGWEYEEKVIEEQIMEQQPNPELEQISAALQQLAMQYQLAQQNQIDQQSMQALQAQIQQLQQQAQQIPQTIQVPKIITHNKPVKNHPTAIVCRNEDVFIDPTCLDDIDKAQFIIYRYESDYTSLKAEGIYENLDSITYDQRDSDWINPDSTEFRFSDKPRKKLMVYEYWGNYDLDGDGVAEPMVCSWIGDTIIRLEHNPFPDKKPPFIIVPFTIIPFTLYGESNAELLSDVQKVKTAIYRGFIDNMAMSNNGQKGIRQGALDLINKKRFMNGENFEFMGSAADFYDGRFNELPGSIFNFVQMLNNEAESITGVLSFNGGINGNSLGATSTGVQGAMDSANSRRLNIVRNIAENLIKPLLRKWLAYDAVFLDEETQFRITNDEFVWLRRDDLGANIDIELSISTSDDNKATANELAFLLQTIGPNENPAIRQMIMASICDLYKRPDLAMAIKEYKPEPDPIQQEIAQLQVELLKAQIANEKAKAGRTEADIPLKEAKIQTEQAKASNIASKTDKQDLDYLHQYNGINHKQNMQSINAKNDFRITNNLLKTLNGSQSGVLL